MKKICEVADCGGELLARGLCRKHYLRLWRYGDTAAVKKRSEYIAKGQDSANFKHGMWDHPLYGIWQKMVRRCTVATDTAYKNYGGRGIAVCDRWMNVAAFVQDMAPRPDGASLDRIDNDGNYCPENCRWASRDIQNRNRRYVKLTEEKARQIRSLRTNGMKRKELAEKFCVSEATIKKVISGEYWRSVEKIAPAVADAFKR
jgi:hypothetical protein